MVSISSASHLAGQGSSAGGSSSTRCGSTPTGRCPLPLPLPRHHLRLSTTTTNASPIRTGPVTSPFASAYHHRRRNPLGGRENVSGVGVGVPHAASSSSSPSSSGDGSSNNNSYQALRSKLASYGVAGVVAYGILNTLYYTVAFVAAWFFLQPGGPPASGAGWSAAAKSIATVMAGTWVGSQVTKIARAAGAVALAPLVDRLLERVAAKVGGGGKGRAVAVVVGTCLCMWGAVFLGVLASVA